MAQTIIIEQGDELLQDVELTTPDTQVNFNCPDKYPVNNIVGGAYDQKTFTDASGTEFTSPTPARAPAGDDEGETGETETGETETGETETGESV